MLWRLTLIDQPEWMARLNRAMTDIAPYSIKSRTSMASCSMEGWCRYIMWPAG